MVQYVLDLDDRGWRAREIGTALKQHFGRPPEFAQLDPVSEMVNALISCRTRDEITRRVFLSLRRQSGRWENVRDASETVIEAAIEPVTHARDKACRLRTSLTMITASFGRLTLQPLEDYTVREALHWLERLPGVGRKVSAATVNFSSLQKPALVIDTGCLRLLHRLGFIGRRDKQRRAYETLMPLLPLDWQAAKFAEYHQLLKRLHKTHCTRHDPACPCCPLKELCPRGAMIGMSTGLHEPCV